MKRTRLTPAEREAAAREFVRLRAAGTHKETAVSKIARMHPGKMLSRASLFRWVRELGGPESLIPTE